MLMIILISPFNVVLDFAKLFWNRFNFKSLDLFLFSFVVVAAC